MANSPASAPEREALANIIGEAMGIPFPGESPVVRECFIAADAILAAWPRASAAPSATQAVHIGSVANGANCSCSCTVHNCPVCTLAAPSAEQISDFVELTHIATEFAAGDIAEQSRFSAKLGARLQEAGFVREADKVKTEMEKLGWEFETFAEIAAELESLSCTARTYASHLAAKGPVPFVPDECRCAALSAAPPAVSPSDQSKALDEIIATLKDCENVIDSTEPEGWRKLLVRIRETIEVTAALRSAPTQEPSK